MPQNHDGYGVCEHFQKFVLYIEEIKEKNQASPAAVGGWTTGEKKENYIPVEPKPPIPRAVTDKSSTITK